VEVNLRVPSHLINTVLQRQARATKVISLHR
jgi:hypothetical protein